MYTEKRTDMVMITQNEYKRLLRIDAMVDLVLHMLKTDNYLSGTTIASILTIDKKLPFEPTASDFAEVDDGYQE